MDLTTTLIILGVCAAGFAFSAWRTSRPSDPIKGPRLIPWTSLAILFGMGALLMLVHVANIAGIETGQGRF
ncbi:MULTISPECIES: hypothetical protein [Marinicauda]|jgi:hypothetical protein|uniref:hypothetical protein n=1 Tax=Marinicauda TaxID=1649466 RepID=UPI0022E879CC|nr:hypothetical protein [Marinicauda sp. Alg238-R41]